MGASLDVIEQELRCWTDLSAPLPCSYRCPAEAVCEAVLTRRCPCGPRTLCELHRGVVLALSRTIPGLFSCGWCSAALGRLVRMDPL